MTASQTPPSTKSSASTKTKRRLAISGTLQLGARAGPDASARLDRAQRARDAEPRGVDGAGGLRVERAALGQQAAAARPWPRGGRPSAGGRPAARRGSSGPRARRAARPSGRGARSAAKVSRGVHDPAAGGEHQRAALGEHARRGPRARGGGSRPRRGARRSRRARARRPPRRAGRARRTGRASRRASLRPSVLLPAPRRPSSAITGSSASPPGPRAAPPASCRARGRARPACAPRCCRARLDLDQEARRQRRARGQLAQRVAALARAAAARCRPAPRAGGRRPSDAHYSARTDESVKHYSA